MQRPSNYILIFRVDFKNWKDEDDDEEEGQGQDLGEYRVPWPSGGVLCRGGGEVDKIEHKKSSYFCNFYTP